MTIRQKQWQLYYLGYYGNNIDGLWGAASRAATRRFQQEHGLEADGIFGALTIAKSTQIIGDIQKKITDGKLAIDGLAGQETKDATARWQTEHGLEGDGIAGVKTRAMLAQTQTGGRTSVTFHGRNLPASAESIATGIPHRCSRVSWNWQTGHAKRSGAQPLYPAVSGVPDTTPMWAAYPAAVI